MLQGLNCGPCRKAGPYVTAYEIAVKNGYEGTEAEWVASLNSVYLARVTTAADGAWTCGVTLDEFLTLAKQKEVHLLTLAGRTAFCSYISEDEIRFRTPTYESETHSLYEEYSLTESGGTYEIVDVDDRDAGSVTKAMLAVAVQNSLDGAVQKSAQATKTDDQTQAVGVDGSGKLYVRNVTDYIPASVQPASTGMYCAVGLDANQQLWAEGYKKPAGGIPYSDLSSDLLSDINLAPIIGIVIVGTTNNGNTVWDVDWQNTDLHGYQSIPEAINAAADVRAIISGANTFAEHPFVNSPDPNQLVFAGPEYDTYGSGTASIVYYILDSTQPHVQRIEKILS